MSGAAEAPSCSMSCSPILTGPQLPPRAIGPTAARQREARIVQRLARRSRVGCRGAYTYLVVGWLICCCNEVRVRTTRGRTV
jgi:hypothetical protein